MLLVGENLKALYLHLRFTPNWKWIELGARKISEQNSNARAKYQNPVPAKFINSKVDIFYIKMIKICKSCRMYKEKSMLPNQLPTRTPNPPPTPTHFWIFYVQYILDQKINLTLQGSFASLKTLVAPWVKQTKLSTYKL